MMDSFGLGVEEDKAEAFRWIKEAAEAGFDRAQYNAGKMYRDGTGTPRDMAQAVKWYRAAAQTGYAKAQASLGQRYARGEGVEKDLVQALFWTTLSANTGLERARDARGALIGIMGPDEIAAAEKLAGGWKPAAK